MYFKYPENVKPIEYLQVLMRSLCNEHYPYDRRLRRLQSAAAITDRAKVEGTPAEPGSHLHEPGHGAFYAALKCVYCTLRV